MNRNYYIKLTLGVYRVTDLFPEKEPLRLKIREKANDLLADLILASKENPGFKDKELVAQVSNEITVLKSLFDLAESQNWVDRRNILVLKKEYNRINQLIKDYFQETIEKQLPLQRVGQELEKKETKTKVRGILNDRQKKIIKILGKGEKLQVWEAKNIFPDVTKRTLRRDFENLLGQGLIKRIGERNNTFYQLFTP